MLVPGMYLVDRYEILEKIGSGGMSDVYKAKCHKLNRLVAIKVLKQEFSTDATFVKKFRVEAQSAAGLSHPNIVNVYDVGEENGIYFIVMELVQGITLKKYIEMKGKLDIKEALNISVQIASGLVAAHDNRIIHRDIKPQNIIMSRDGKVKVTDFGIAKVADSTTVTTTAAGSVHYISPEQARGGYSDAKSDIYSLGITMYEMVTGRVPFDGETNVAVALLHIQGEMIPPRKLEPSIPRSFEKIILKCTQKKPDRRYASAKELIADLRLVLTQPDGDYVVLGSVSGATDATMVLGNLDGMDQRSGETVVLNSSGGGGSNGQRPQQNGQQRPPVQNVNRNRQPASPDDDDEDDDNVNPALEKVMMVLGIVGAVILVIIIFFIIGKAAGLFSGSNKNTTESLTTESASTELSTESESETPATVEIPKLIGLTQAEAEKELKKYDLYMKIINEVSDEYEEGQIFKQTPDAGTTIEKGEIITVYISSGKTKFTLDTLEGLTETQAKSKLEAKKLKLADIYYENSDTIAEGQVIRTDPAAGSQVSEGDGIVLYISKGPQYKNISMPSVTGLTLEEAKTTLTNNNLIFGTSTEEYSNDVTAGKVIRASYSTGASIKEGTTVDLVISKGKQSFSARILISESPLGGYEADQKANVEISVVKPDGSLEVILSKDMVPADWVKIDQTVTSTSGGSGSYQIIVDGNTITSQSITFN